MRLMEMQRGRVDLQLVADPGDGLALGPLVGVALSATVHDAGESVGGTRHSSPESGGKAGGLNRLQEVRVTTS